MDTRRLCLGPIFAAAGSAQHHGRQTGVQVKRPKPDHCSIHPRALVPQPLTSKAHGPGLLFFRRTVATNLTLNLNALVFAPFKPADFIETT
jgi:hypothetical protein